MGLEKLIQVAALAICCALSGQLPHVLKAVWIAELRLLSRSQASK
jgi:hypothetical protein